MVNEIQSTGGSYRPDQVHGVNRTRSEASRASGNDPRADRVEISDQAYWRAKLASLPEVRQEKVDAVKAQIAAGTYETDEKFTGAADALLEDFALGF